MSVFSDAFNIPLNIANTVMTAQNNKFNREISQKNFDLQKEIFSYNKDLQQQIFAREDNSVQRRAADMTAAGLSKTLAAGNGSAAGSVVGVSAPQQSQVAFQQFQQAQSDSFIDTAIGMLKAKADITKTYAEADALQYLNENRQADTALKTRQQILTDANTLLSQANTALADAKTKTEFTQAERNLASAARDRLQTAIEQHDWDFLREIGVLKTKSNSQAMEWLINGMSTGKGASSSMLRAGKAVVDKAGSLGSVFSDQLDKLIEQAILNAGKASDAAGKASSSFSDALEKWHKEGRKY